MAYSIEQRDEQLLNTTAPIRYHWYFDNAHRHLVRIVMEIDNNSDNNSTAEPLTLGLPVWIPGSYKVRDYISTLGSFTVTDADGTALVWQWISKNRLQIASPTQSVHVEYFYYAFERDSTIRSSHVTRSHAFINPVTCALYVEGREHEIHHVCFHYDRTKWATISTPLSPVKSAVASDEPLVLGALNYDILVDSPVEIGNHFVSKFLYENSVVETAVVGRGNYDADWIARQIETIVTTEAQMWGGLPFDRYVFIIHLFPTMRGGGLEHARCSVNAVESGNWSDTAKLHNLLSLLCHEFFHVWNIKRIRPRELGPFDYNQENLTRMLWLVEGATSYYDDMLTYRCGFYTRDEYFKVISKDHLGRFFRTPGRLQASIKDNSYQAWVKLYLPHDESVNRNVSYYLHGGLIFMLLDFWIITQSKGIKRLDDGFRALWSVYQQRPATGITEDEFIEVVESATGVTVRERLTQWLNSTAELPFDEVFGAMGLAWQPAPVKDVKPSEGTQPMTLVQKLFTGATLKAENGKILVAQVEENTPAEASGLAPDDEILFVNSTRVASVDDVEYQLAKRGTESASQLVIASDAAMEAIALQPVLQPEFVFAVAEAANDEQKRWIEFWLARS